MTGEIALIALIDYSQWGQALFGTAPIAALPLVSVLPFALSMIAAEEGRKLIVRRLRSTARGVRARAVSTELDDHSLDLGLDPEDVSVLPHDVSSAARAPAPLTRLDVLRQCQ